jgi:HD-GYP domain-containing protein (c-di-GMP phosphodiesterase class II)
MLVVPLKTSKGQVVGVMELINVIDEEKNITTFSLNDKLFVTQFANYAGIAIERAIMLRDVVLRMIKLSELRDPEETQQHVNRVGSYAIEIYQRWAERHNVPKEEFNNYKDILRIAAMLHDVGKVGVSDIILKKKGKLTPEEFEEIKFHTIHGARLFNVSRSDWEIMAREITLNHHERWDGTGYPGKIEDIHRDENVVGAGKKGLEIPLSARIVCIADVYDALISARSYKEPWDEKEVLNYIKDQSGKQFDPELVEIFFEIYDIIQAIKDKYTATIY